GGLLGVWPVVRWAAISPGEAAGPVRASAGYESAFRAVVMGTFCTDEINPRPQGMLGTGSGSNCMAVLHVPLGVCARGRFVRTWFSIEYADSLESARAVTT